MITLPDGAKMIMSWKSVKYINHNDFIIFQIVPMLNSEDIVIFPDVNNWKKINNVFPITEREEIIFLLERSGWKREIKIIELNIPAEINSENKCIKGSLECTTVYSRLTDENLFDFNSKLSKEQVKSIYLSLEKKFASTLQGNIKISKNLLLVGSVMKEYIVPILEENKNLKITFV